MPTYNTMDSMKHQPTGNIFCMTPILVEGFVEPGRLLGDQGPPILFLSMFYLSGHLKFLVDENKTNN
jgi:hypothetical protein